MRYTECIKTQIKSWKAICSFSCIRNDIFIEWNLNKNEMHMMTKMTGFAMMLYNSKKTKLKIEWKIRLDTDLWDKEKKINDKNRFIKIY